jgi:hypothetical protein
MRRNLFLIAVGLFLLARVASAHEYKYAGTLSVLLHMEPGDSPIASEPAQLFFYFKDEAKKFRATECNCTVTIKSGDNTLREGPVEGAAKGYGEDVRMVNFTFPDVGIYTVTLNGTPKNGAFEPFLLNYDVRIERVPEGGIKRPPNYALLWGVAAGGIIILSAVGLLIKKKIG